LLQHFEGDANLALMGYNAGPGNVDAWLQEPTGQNEDDLLRFVPFGETREYVARVALNYLIYRTLYAAP
jgi:soluble lytic murein transglycosylase